MTSRRKPPSPPRTDLRYLQLPLPRLTVGFYPARGDELEQAARATTQAAIEAAVRATIATPTKLRRPRSATPELARARREAAGAAALAESAMPGPRMTWAIRFYYYSEGDELLAAEFHGLSEQRAEALRDHHRRHHPDMRDNGSMAVAVQVWDARPPRLTEADGAQPVAAEAPKVLYGARVVVWPGEDRAASVPDPSNDDNGEAISPAHTSG